MFNNSLHTSRRLNTPPGPADICVDGQSANALPARKLQSSPDIPRAELLGSIVCVEHEQKAAAPIAETLSHLGYAVDVAQDGEVGLAKILANRPDLILCNSSAPRIGGLELLEQLSRVGADFPKAPFILLTEHPSRDNELAARKLGADECLTKPIDLEMLSVVVKNRLRNAVVKEFASEQSSLTNRQRVVLTWVARGKTSGEIALILKLTERTVNFHCEQAMKRLDVMNRTQAVAKAITHQLINP